MKGCRGTCQYSRDGVACRRDKVSFHWRLVPGRCVWGGEGFGLPLAADAVFVTFGPFGVAVVADAVCCAAPPFFVLRTMMVLWFVRVLDSKNKLLRFCTTIFRHGKIFTPVPTGKGNHKTAKRKPRAARDNSRAAENH